MQPKVATDRQGGQTVWYDPALFHAFPPALFDPARLERDGLVTGRSQGRNTAWFFRHAGREMVLRHYYRGGMVGRINRDLFLRMPVAQSRAMQEYALLDWMRGQGLPVPRPCAARFSPAMGLFYRADLVTEMLPGTRTLADSLHDAPPPEVWAEIGRTIARFHAHDVCHSDLNCRNILLDGAGKVWLIDFDKSARRPDGAWKQGNIDRLERSLRKEAASGPAAAPWDDAGWAALVAGHAQGRAA